MELKKRAVIELTLQETEDLQQAAEKKRLTMDELLNACFQDAVDVEAVAQKPMEGNDGMECPRCGNVKIDTLGKYDKYCRECGMKFDLS